jgi:hypothetical protein
VTQKVRATTQHMQKRRLEASARCSNSQLSSSLLIGMVKIDVTGDTTIEFAFCARPISRRYSEKIKRPCRPKSKGGPGSQINTPPSNQKIRQDSPTKEGQAFASHTVECGGDTFRFDHHKSKKFSATLLTYGTPHQFKASITSSLASLCVNVQCG